MLSPFANRFGHCRDAAVAEAFQYLTIRASFSQQFDRPGADATIHWTIQRDDLTTLRFDRAQVLVYWNP